jgi:hypothetical protein
MDLEVVMNVFAKHDWGGRALFARSVTIAVIGTAFLAAFLLDPAPTMAQSVDMRRADLVEQLDAQYAEAQAAVGVTDEGGVVEVFTSDDGSTWTLVLTKPDGTSRIVAAGETWIKR